MGQMTCITLDHEVSGTQIAYHFNCHSYSCEHTCSPAVPIVYYTRTHVRTDSAYVWGASSYPCNASRRGTAILSPTIVLLYVVLSVTYIFKIQSLISAFVTNIYLVDVLTKLKFKTPVLDISVSHISMGVNAGAVRYAGLICYLILRMASKY